MPTVLGRDPAARVAARFGGRLRSATITRVTVSGPNTSDSAGPPSSGSATYTCDAIAFGYKGRHIDGQLMKKADYRVVVLLGSVRDSSGELVAGFTPHPGDSISCPPPGQDAPKTGRVVDVSPVTHAAATCHVMGSL